MKFISWNVNGIRACITKGFEERFHELDADIFCLQETKCQQGQVKLELPGYHQYWNYANRRGYSGTAIFTKREPLSAACQGNSSFSLFIIQIHRNPFRRIRHRSISSSTGR